MGYAAVVLAGGAGSRLGGAAKPALPVGGRPMLHRVLAAVADASVRIVVGPPDLPLPERVRRTLELPPGGGPVAATAAGLALAAQHLPQVALLAADLPLLTAAAVSRLRAAAGQSGADGALFVDGTGRAQWLCGVWRTAALRARLAEVAGPAGAPYPGLPLWRLLGDLRAVPVRGESAGGEPVAGAPPWWDCDTGADLRRAEELLHGDLG